MPELRRLFEELEFRSILRELQPNTAAKQESAVQGSLFGEEAMKPQSQSASLKTVRDYRVDYRVAATAEERRALLDELGTLSEFAFDTETTGLDPILSQLVGISFSTKPQCGWWVPIPANQQEAQSVVNEFKTLFENPAISKIGQNIKFDMLMLRNYGVNLQGFLFDTMLAHYLLEPEQRHNLSILSEQLLGYQPITIEELIGKKGSNQINMRNVPLDKITVYACEDADLAFQIKQILYNKLIDEGLMELYTNLEAPLIEVLAEMERTGVAITPSA
jgi:DNA polymerase-1